MLFSPGIKASKYPSQKSNESLSRPRVFHLASSVIATIVLGNVPFGSSQCLFHLSNVRLLVAL